MRNVARRSPAAAKEFRNELAGYFTAEGRLSWQDDSRVRTHYTNSRDAVREHTASRLCVRSETATRRRRVTASLQRSTRERLAAGSCPHTHLIPYLIRYVLHC
ncbi:hypothetical protein ACJJTC_013749 [Scirpophaga incertulas]